MKRYFFRQYRPGEVRSSRLRWALPLACTLGLISAAGISDTNWQRLETVASDRFGATGTASVSAWRHLLATAPTNNTIDTLGAVNNFFNERIRWTDDNALFGQSDYWATPLEVMALGAGDCEDFSIAKYVSLLALGLPASSLRLVYVKATRAGLPPQAHMVLAWYEYPDATPLILDNINPLLLPADKRRDLQPVFSFNHTDLWMGATGKHASADPRARMARWQQVLNKITAEGMTID